MNIILTVHQFLLEHATGTELIAYHLACELRRRGHRVTFVTASARPSDDGDLHADTYQYDGFTVHRLSLPDWRHAPGGAHLEYDNPVIGRWFEDFLRRHSPDLVHFLHLSRLSASLIDACAATDTPCVFTPTDFWALCRNMRLRLDDGSLCPGPDPSGANCLAHLRRDIDRGILLPRIFDDAPSSPALPSAVAPPQVPDRLTQVRRRQSFIADRLGQVGRILPPSRVMAEALLAHGVDPARLRRIPYGVPVERIDRRHDKGAGRLPKGPLRVVYVGQIAEHKGCHVLAQALRLLPEAALRVHFHGDHSQNPAYVRQLEDLLRGDARATLAGPFEHRDLSRVLGAADVLVCPSLWLENTPLVMLEAMAAGVPVIATDLPGMAEIVEPGVSGFLFPAGDAPALAKILQRLADDPAQVARLSVQTLVPLSTAEHAAQVEGVYRELLGHSSDLRYSLDTPLPESIVVGRGTQFILEGWAYCLAWPIVRLEVEMTCGTRRRRVPVVHRGNARPDVLAGSSDALDPWQKDRALRSGFWCLLPLEPSAEDRTENFRLVATLRTGEVLFSGRHRLHLQGSGPAALRPLPRPAPLPAPPFRPRVCICMASYNPTEAMLRRQVDSIRAQDYPNWICLVQDDWSSEEGRAVIQRVIGDDPRFVIEWNPRNLGFFANFERVLGRVPPGCQLVSLADQDDRWNPDKLSRLVAAFDAPDVTLAYSDMRIVDAAGTVLSNTYWATRSNNYTDLETLYFANTITGAASLFRADLLPRILPFPPRRGPMYHDWWIALVALAQGTIRYIDAPLYDYYQHEGNVIGWSHIHRGVSIPALLRSHQYRRELAHVAENRYNHHGKFLASAIATLSQRVDDSPRQPALRRLGRLPREPFRTLLSQSLRSLVCRRASLNLERHFLMAHSVMQLLNRYFSLKTRLTAGLRPPATSLTPAAPGTGPRHMHVDTIQHLLNPLRLEVRAGETQRVNMLLATIDFRYFFGGYIGMFQLARRLAAAGCRVRFVTLNACHESLAQWRQNIRGCAGLEDIFDVVEVEQRVERGVPLTVSPQDRWIATSCWSAWVADSAARQLGGPSFTFMIQEYEPYFMPHGSYYALSHAAYALDHFALFSTAFLEQHFRQEKIGICARPAGDRPSAVFQNAVLAFDVRPETLQRRPGTKRKLLFYCRPEPHAERNLFELGILALRRAVARGVLDPAAWEFYGIGTVGEGYLISLGDCRGRAAELTALPKMSLQDYARYLPDFDLGLSLMYTPHPSLVPLEMASAGLVTVTNSYANKTPEALHAISPNFEVGEATIDGLAAALARAAARVDDHAARAAGSSIHWPTRWEDALSPQVLAPLLQALHLTPAPP